ncbi:alpha/beta hydrolase [Nonomuraea sp. NPDC049504]|uniref:alpha/beta fold hydrolase n=1 Tax=Nonomuraea sp. NPDC049504 TaxID=3154729 RepID=UPI0034319A23
MESYADALAAEVADLDDYVLVGDSFGANIALGPAVRRPAGLRALVMSGGFAADSRRLFLDHTPAKTFGSRLTAALAADYTDRLGQVDVPTLIITPSRDRLIGERAAEIMRTGIPGAREVVLDRTGHMFRFSHPATYAAAVETFLVNEVAHAAR